jgi:putative membrane protein
MAFLQIDKERAQLIDHIGACERILKTPLAQVYSIKIRRFLLLFLLTLPFVLLHRMQSSLMIPPICMLVAYLLLALDCAGDELQNPFSEQNLSHLPLGDISKTIEQNLLAMSDEINLFEGESLVTTFVNGDDDGITSLPFYGEKPAKEHVSYSRQAPY